MTQPKHPKPPAPPAATPEHAAKMRTFIASRTEAATTAGDCQDWTGSLDSHGTPIMRKPGQRTWTPVRRVLLELAGRHIGTRLASTKCSNSLCVCPAHILPMTRSQLHTRSAQASAYPRSIARRMAIAAKRRTTTHMTLESVAELRASGLPSRAAGLKYGLSQSSASAILGHRTWRNYASPFAGLMA